MPVRPAIRDLLVGSTQAGVVNKPIGGRRGVGSGQIATTPRVRYWPRTTCGSGRSQRDKRCGGYGGVNQATESPGTRLYGIAAAACDATDDGMLWQVDDA